MAENSVEKSSHTKDQVLSTFGDSFDEKLTLEDKSEQSRLYATVNQQTGQPKKQSEVEESSSCKTDNHSSSNTDNHGDAARTTEESDNVFPDKNTNPVCFSIEMGNACISQPPKRLLAKTRNNKNATATLASLNDKQIQAEKRRKQQRENRLQRIHDRQEAARKLAQSVDILLQQRALAMGVAGDTVTPLPSRQIMATAHQVAQNFRDLTNQLGNDLSVNDRFEAKKSKVTCPKSKTRAGSQNRQSTSQSVSFTVEVPSEDKTKSRKPVLSPKQKKVLTVEDLEEKQRQAQERRNKRQERKVQRVKENREALMKMAKDIEKFKNLQQSTDSSPDSMEHIKETALLAEKIATGFDRLSQRYDEDLKRAENFSIEQPYVMDINMTTK